MNNPIWMPQNPKSSKMWQFMCHVNQAYSLNFIDYQSLHNWSVEQPDLFWSSLCDYFDIRFKTPPTCILKRELAMIGSRWFEGASFNFAEQLLSRDDNHPAIISLDEQGNRSELSYHDLRSQVSRCAAGLKQAGVGVGDRVAAIMPNIAITIIAMLSCASIGAIWSSCSSDFGVGAIMDRLGQIEPKVLFICNQYEYQGRIHDESSKIQQICELMPYLNKMVICPNANESSMQNNLPMNSPNRVLWDDFLQKSSTLDFIPLPFDHPLYILFSSGTTGKPKCIMHGAGGTLLQHIKELGLHTDMDQSDNLFFYTTCGWMMWNWMVSALALGSTITLYNGAPNYPDASRLFNLIDHEKITVFGTSPKYLASIQQNGIQPIEHFNLSTLRCILSTGSPLLVEQYEFVYRYIKANIQLSSISGGTDIVSCFALGNPMLPVYLGELQCLGLGMNVAVFDEQGHAIKKSRGELVCTTPFPSMPIAFWNDPDNKRYQSAYFSRFEGIWAHGDFAEVTVHEGLIIYGRSDTVLNPGGIRIGTAEIYRQIEKIPTIIDSVVIAQNWQQDVRIVLFVKLSESHQLDDTIENTIREILRSEASPRHVPAKIVQVADIPRTLNGKLVELAVKQTVHGEKVTNIESLANPNALACFKDRKELQN